MDKRRETEFAETGFSPEQIRLHRKILKAKGPRWRARIAKIAERERKAQVLLDEIHKGLPKDMTSVVMVNADTKEWFNKKNVDACWREARKRWGKDIAGPPIHTITLTEPEEYIPPPEIFRI
ncbi:MAG: hypothetical protein AAB850_01715 [Patescibacteria group bacterium]